MPNILFVCTDNYARSVVAEFCFNDYVRRKRLGEWRAISAGLRADSDTSQYSTAHFERLEEWGIDLHARVRRQLEERLLDEADVVVAMGAEHKAYIESKFRRHTCLFNEIARGEAVSVALDPSDEIGIDEKMRKLTDNIRDSIPAFVERLPQYIQPYTQGGRHT